MPAALCSSCISLYIDVFAWFFQAINKPAWTEGLHIVPLLALANIFLGVYYNLSIWYKLTNKNMTGAAITIGGAIITIVLNIWLIPKYHYPGAAIATFCCYLFMMITSYLLGQKNYPVPYAVKKLMAYIVIVVIAICAPSRVDQDMGKPLVQPLHSNFIIDAVWFFCS